MTKSMGSSMEIRERVQEIQCQLNFLGAVLTSDLILGESARTGALIIFNGIQSQLQVLSERTDVER